MEMLSIMMICVVIFIIQLLLCFKVKKLVIKLIPVVLLLIAFIVFMILLLTASGWDALGYIVFVMLSVIFLIPCAIGWVIWAIWHYLKKKNAN